MPKLGELKSNLKAEAEGAWNEAPELGFDDETGEAVRLLTRSLHYPPFVIELQQTRLRLARQYPGSEVVPPDVEDRENGRLYAKHLLLNWQSLDPAFSEEVAREALMDVAHRSLRAAVRTCAALVGQPRREQIAALVGNLPPALAGN